MPGKRLRQTTGAPGHGERMLAGMMAGIERTEVLLIGRSALTGAGMKGAAWSSACTGHDEARLNGQRCMAGLVTQLGDG